MKLHVALTSGMILLMAMAASAQDSLHIEDLTWTEVDAAIKGGKTTAIVMAAGMEQNGPHMAMGKHVAIAHYVSGQVARELGNALALPIMPFAPAGNPGDRTDGMMKYPGNISVSDDAFRGVMRDLALSAIAAGFRDVVIMGDHGGGQATLRKLAADLNEQYSGGGVRVHFSDRGYAAARDEFVRQMAARGIKAGGHASLQDTSEILLLKPEWIRKDKIALASESNGVIGDPRPSTPQFGQLYLDIKVRMAVDEIRALTGKR